MSYQIILYYMFFKKLIDMCHSSISSEHALLFYKFIDKLSDCSNRSLPICFSLSLILNLTNKLFIKSDYYGRLSNNTNDT